MVCIHIQLTANRCACQKGARDSVNCEQVRVPEGSASAWKNVREVAVHHQCRPPSEAESTPAEEEKRARLRRGKTAKAGHEDTGGSDKEEKMIWYREYYELLDSKKDD